MLFLLHPPFFLVILGVGNNSENEMFRDVDGSINCGDADNGEQHCKSEIAGGSVVDVDACTSIGVDADGVLTGGSGVTGSTST
jgi:hypothetical protein